MFILAQNTFREIIRNRFFSLLFFLAVVFIAFSLVLDTLSLGETRRVLFDFGLSFLELSGFAIILFLAGGMLAREIEGRTIYLILSKPTSRGSIILGKFLGFSSVLLLVLIAELALLLALIFFSGYSPDGLFFLAVLGIWLKLESLLALILLFSTFVGSAVAIFMTIASYIIGHSGFLLLEYVSREHATFQTFFAKAVLALFPNLEALNLKNYVATTAVLDTSRILESYGVSTFYIVIVLVLAMKLFERKNFDMV
jgi:ABC-type transport system involved in multi-copper enzyme maturation permease subunit